MSMDFHEFFLLGMKRDLPGFRLPPEKGLRLNVGSGHTIIDGCLNVDHPSNLIADTIHWDADHDGRMPIPSESVAEIHCYHFLEHCVNPAAVLFEFQRVLKHGGVVHIVVPHYSSQLAIEDLDHKHQFCEDSWKTLLRNTHYNKNGIPWQFTIGINFIAGVVERNLCVFTQLIKE